MLAIKYDDRTFFSYEHAGDYIAEKLGITYSRNGSKLDIYKDRQFLESYADMTPHQYLISLAIRHTEG